MYIENCMYSGNKTCISVEFKLYFLKMKMIYYAQWKEYFLRLKSCCSLKFIKTVIIKILWCTKSHK